MVGGAEQVAVVVDLDAVVDELARLSEGVVGGRRGRGRGLGRVAVPSVAVLVPKRREANEPGVSRKTTRVAVGYMPLVRLPVLLARTRRLRAGTATPPRPRPARPRRQPITPSLQPSELVNDSVQVYDNGNLLGPTDHSIQFSYPESFPGTAGTCTTHDNTATVKNNQALLATSNTVTVEVCGWER